MERTPHKCPRPEKFYRSETVTTSKVHTNICILQYKMKIEELVLEELEGTAILYLLLKAARFHLHTTLPYV